MSHLDKFSPETLSVAEYEHWVVTVRGKQVTPGSLVVLPRVAYERFAEIQPAAAVELVSVLGRIEGVAIGPLRADRVNLVAAMMKDPFVHFHFFPRFEGAVERFGNRWLDEDWPRAVTLRDVDTSPEVLARVKGFYAEQLGSSD